MSLKKEIEKAAKVAASQRVQTLSFADSLACIMERENVSRKRLAAMSTVSESTISRMRRNDDYAFSKKSVIAICVALGLDSAEAFSMLEKSGHKLKLTSPQDVAYHHVLCSCDEYSVDEVNEMLEEYGYEAIGG